MTDFSLLIDRWADLSSFLWTFWTEQVVSVLVVGSGVVTLLLPGCVAETEREYGGEKLDGKHADHHGDDGVDLVIQLIVDLFEAALVHVRVVRSRSSQAIGVLELGWIVFSQLTACLRNLGTQQIQQMSK